MKYLFLIPARSGSKGIPNKNIKLLNGKPLIKYAIDVAMDLTAVEHICLSTDDIKIKKVGEQCGITVPFLRPKELAQDESTTFDVILHAVNFFSERSKEYDAVVLLQPTSPLRISTDIQNALSLFELKQCDAVISVCEAPSNPFYVHFQEDEHGNLKKLFDEKYTRRQDVPTVYELNGAVYVLSTKSLFNYGSILEFPTVKKVVMPLERSIDVDTEYDWRLTEFILNNSSK